MSIKVSIIDMAEELKLKIDTELTINIKSQKNYGANNYKTIYPYLITDEHAYLPFAYSVKLGLCRPSRNSFPVSTIIFNTVLREEQTEVKKEIIENLNRYGCTIVYAYTGFGKSITTIYIASKLKLKTLIILNRLVLIKQWSDSIKKFCDNATVQCVKPKSKKQDCDFYIINAINVSKMGHDFFSDIGFVIIDEVHLIIAEKISECLKYITPRYVIGLSATPNRFDGMDILFDLYCGESRVHRKLNRHHIAYQVDSKFIPTVELLNGKINWNTVIESQSNDIDRNELIIKIIKFFRYRIFLVICKRISQADYILNRLESDGEDVTGLFGNRMKYNENSRILIGTTGKCSTGFDHPRLDTLLLASDVEAYYQQVLGRIFRTKEGVPIIFDIVDNNSILKKHWRTRRAVYIEQGGQVKNFYKEFKEFKDFKDFKDFE
jgi:superfamily II DNA or RNA helicase